MLQHLSDIWTPILYGHNVYTAVFDKFQVQVYMKDTIYFNDIQYLAVRGEHFRTVWF